MRAVDIFIAYSHNDLRHKDELKKFLRPLLNTGQARIWDDYEIEGGQDWEAEIKKRLYGADIILLLVSPDSLASEYFYGQEVKVSLERHDKGEATVVPVILRPCTWTMTPLKRLEALPEKGRPITSWASQDEAYTDVAHNIGSIVESRQALITAATQQEDQRREFAAAAETAEHLFHKKQWAEAQKAFASALQLHRPGFSPDRTTLQSRMASCVTEQEQAAAAAVLQEKRTAYEALLLAADHAETPDQIRQIQQKALQLQQSGFPDNMELLQQRLKAAREKWPAPPVPEKTQAPVSTQPFNARPLLLGGIALVLLLLALFAFRQCSRNDKPARTEPQQPQQQTLPTAPTPRWQTATTIPALQDWLDNNPKADAKDRTDANQRLEALRQQRKRDLKDASRAIQYKDYQDAEKFIQSVLVISPNDKEGLLLRKKIPRK